MALNNSKGELVCIKPKTVDQDFKHTKDEVTKHINPAKLQLGVTNLRHNKQGDILINCANKTSASVLIQEMEDVLGEKYISKISPKYNPRLKIININDDELQGIDLCEAIIAQNNLDIDSADFHLKMITTVKRKTGSTFVVIETDPRTRLQLLREGNIYIGWKQHRVFDHFYLKQCYKCAASGHTSINFRNTKTCLKCSASHSEHECTASQLTCVNCVKSNARTHTVSDVQHDARYWACPIAIKMTSQLKERIAGGNDNA